MAQMPPPVRWFVFLLLGAWAGFAGWSAMTQGLWMRWLLALFLVGCMSYLRRNNDAARATLLPPAAMVLSFGLDALQREDLPIAGLCLVGFAALLGVAVRILREQVDGD